MTSGDTQPRSDQASERRPGRRRAEPARSSRSGRRTALAAPGLPRLSWQSRPWRYSLIALAVMVLAGWLTWYSLTPPDLATDDQSVSASGVAGTPIYVGMYNSPTDAPRTLRVSGVRVHTTTNVDLAVTPLLCRRGAVGVTTKPEQFCNQLVNPEGERLVPGDSIVVKIDSPHAAIAIVDRIEIAYREDIRWDTQPAGHQRAIVTLTARPDNEAD